MEYGKCEWCPNKLEESYKKFGPYKFCCQKCYSEYFKEFPTRYKKAIDDMLPNRPK